MPARLNTKLALAVGAAMVWAWLGLLLALRAPEPHRGPMIGFDLKEGAGIVLQGRLAHLLEDDSGIRIALHRPAGLAADPQTPKLPDGISVEYLPTAERPRRPQIKVQHGFGPVPLPSRGLLVAAREYIFKIDRGSVKIVVAPPGSPLRRRLEQLERERPRERMGERRREERRERMREGMREQRGPGERGAPFGGEAEHPADPPPAGQAELPPTPKGEAGAEGEAPPR